ncbi:MAG: hypothetical protein KIH63_002550 [Candidatus Saccharibacteria bacterium]|nr:hypothetical protein [Candidatus Saccharibacteria bacterium]
MSGYGQQEQDLYVGIERHGFVPQPVSLDVHELALVACQASVRGFEAPEWSVLRGVIRNEDWQLTLDGSPVRGSFGLIHCGVRAAVNGALEDVERAITGFVEQYPSLGNKTLI